MQFELKIDKVQQLISDNYYEPLGIKHDRAMELINKVRDALTNDIDGSDQVRAMHYISKQSDDLNETIFMLFKLGEMSGMILAGVDRLAPIQVAMSLAQYRANKIKQN